MGQGGSRRRRGGQSIPVLQGHGQQGEKAPCKLSAWPPPHPAPNWGRGGLQLPARSCVIALANLVGQSPLSLPAATDSNLALRLPPLQTLLAIPPWVRFLGVRIKEE